MKNQRQRERPDISVVAVRESIILCLPVLKIPYVWSVGKQAAVVKSPCGHRSRETQLGEQAAH